MTPAVMLLFIDLAIALMSLLQAYDGRYLAAIGKVVVVTPNYRVGIMGFLNGETELIPGNVGLEDQAMALSWTLENIGYFGGNISRLVIFGHEAGATALGYHIYSGYANEWITAPVRYIMHSGGPFRR